MRLPKTSLVFTLASRNLFQDRLRFVASQIGIVLSVVLVMIQIGLYFGFTRMVTTIIDHAPTDLWIVAKGAKCFEDLSLLSAGLQEQLMAIDRCRRGLSSRGWIFRLDGPGWNYDPGIRCGVGL